MHGSLTSQIERLSPAELDVWADLYRLRGIAEAQEHFHAFRRYMHPDLKWDWWVQEISLALDQFYIDFIAGKRPKLAIFSPPQHGKSMTATDFMAWFAGKQPIKKQIFASYSDELGVRTNGDIQRMMASAAYRNVFPELLIGKPGARNLIANSDHIQYRPATGIIDPNHLGEFRNTTVDGPINGFAMHLGVIDDPVKSRKEAQSLTTRNKIWQWLTDDFFGRFDENAAMLIIMTRWHIDDPMGRLLDKWKGTPVRVLSYPAIAEEEETYRSVGEALFPSHKSADFLLERKGLLTKASWEALYQQKPINVGGGMLPTDKLTVVPLFERKSIVRSIRYWDKAATEGGDGAYSAGCLMHLMQDDTFVIEHVVRGHWPVSEREANITSLGVTDFASYENKSYQLWVEQEPGSGGKESAELTVARNLKLGIPTFADKVDNSKEVRAEPFAAAVQNDRVRLVAATWNYDFVDEAGVFPQGKYKDQIDAAAGAFMKLAIGSGYDTSQEWGQ